MKCAIVAIGNSRGVRIPKAFLKQVGLQDEIEMDVDGSQIVIRAAKHPRADWSEAFTRMAALGDDALLDPTTCTEWDKSEWSGSPPVRELLISRTTHSTILRPFHSSDLSLSKVNNFNSF
jgi:antitoxin MazE